MLALLAGGLSENVGGGAPPPPTVEKISYFYAMHSIQLFMAILRPFDILIFLRDFKDTNRQHDLKNENIAT